jgi:hypothetical protein
MNGSERPTSQTIDDLIDVWWPSADAGMLYWDVVGNVRRLTRIPPAPQKVNQSRMSQHVHGVQA